MLTTLITGGTGGIGRALVDVFAQRGDRVYFTYHRGKDKCAEIEHAYPSGMVSGLSFEQGSYAATLELANALPDRVDVLVNNAALGSATVEQVSADKALQDELLLTVNALGPMWLIEAILPRMRKHGFGKIINISSVGGGIYHYPGFRLADGMSKAAVAFMTKQLAAELVYEPIDIFAVCPGATATAMFSASSMNHLSELEQQQLTSALPKRRLIEPSEIAQICLFLSGEASQVLHGAVIDSSMGLGVNPSCIRK